MIVVLAGGYSKPMVYRTSQDGGATWGDVVAMPGVDGVSKDLADGALLHLFMGSASVTGSAGSQGTSLQWLGGTWHWPFDGDIDASEDLWVNIYSFPQGAGVSARVVYSDDHGATWYSADMVFGGKDGDNDWWHVDLGAFAQGTLIQYAVEVVDGAGVSQWHKYYENDGLDYQCRVNGGAPTYWAGNTSVATPSGQVRAGEDLWIDTEAWPKGGAVGGRLWFTTNGVTWATLELGLAGEAGNNDRLHANMGQLGFPAGTTIQFAIEVIDGFGNATWDNNEGADYEITLE
jgi:hypothetical protein